MESGELLQNETTMSDTLDFIRAFQSLPQLWNNEHSSYYDRNLRLIALNELLQVYRNYKPDASIRDVRSKINTLRSNYRREMYKWEQNKRLGHFDKKPRTLTFEALRFLDKGIGYEDENDKSSITSPSKSLTKKRLGNLKAAKTAKSTRTHCGCEIDPILLMWSRKLKNLHPMQRLLTEKSINDLIFDAELHMISGQSDSNGESVPSTSNYGNSTEAQNIKQDGSDGDSLSSEDFIM